MLLYDLTEHLGPLEEWPTYVLQHIFSTVPPLRAPSGSGRLCYFYGNDVPIRMAYTFYVACCAGVRELQPVSWWSRPGIGTANGIVWSL